LFFRPQITQLGCSPLANAISRDYTYMIERLIDLGADVNVPDAAGDTALIKSIWLATSSTSDVDREADGAIRLIRRLVEEGGADVNARNESGRTALFTAVYENMTDIALYLIDAGATCLLDERDTANYTLIHYAVLQGNLTLEKIFDRGVFFCYRKNLNAFQNQKKS
jgi:ankyrin repeat protein